MKRKMVFLSALVLSVGSLVLLSSCGGNSSSTSDPGGVKTVYVGVLGAYPPFNYTDDNNKLIGYELEILKEVDRRLPQYTFEFQRLAGDVILTSLDAGKIDISVCQWEFNVDRAEKYYFSEGYNDYDLYVQVLESNNTINSIADLGGKTLGLLPGSNDYNVGLKYIQAHPELNIRTFDRPADTTLTLPNFINNTYDAVLANQFNAISSNLSNATQVKLVGNPVSTSEAHFLLRKTKVENDIDALKLLNALDTQILAMKQDGTLALLYEREVTGYLTALAANGY
ncbi:L-cystine-binding protein TcyJ [Spirochaetia bacterium]|nr:L-cystine-binding protein TcyJ [Spirochaetia bacterium]